MSINLSDILYRFHGHFTKIRKRLTPSQIIFISFALLVLTGTLLLSLPISQQPDTDISLVDALFTATSAVCVTGLVTVNTAASWSVFGKIVLICLIQFGGLGVVAFFTLFLVYLGKKVTLRDRLTVQAAFNSSDLKGMVRLVTLVIRGSLLVEGTGAILLGWHFYREGRPLLQSILYGMFHSISAFCNAGFDIVGESSLIPYAGMPVFMGTVIFLIVLGGIGFTVWQDLLMAVRSRLRRKPHHEVLSLHSKLVLLSTGILLLVSTLYFFVAEYNNPATLGGMPWPQKLLAALFQSVTVRTAGFAGVSQEGLYDISKMASSLLMLVGGSPGGTAGGFKTATLAVILCAVWSTLKGRSKITVFERNIPFGVLMKAITVITSMLFLWVGSTVLLVFFERGSAFPHDTLDLLFETASALGTTGLTTGITPFLSTPGRLVVISCMFVGRIGVLAALLSLSQRTSQVSDRIEYPHETIMIG